jgi:hypothetical protein
LRGTSEVVKACPPTLWKSAEARWSELSDFLCPLERPRTPTSSLGRQAIKCKNIRY